MTEHTLLIHPGQENRIVKAYHHQRGCQIKVRKPVGEFTSSLDGPTRGKLLLTPSQEKKYADASPGDIKLPFSYKQLHDNSHHSGGFIPLILAALASSVAGGLIERGIAGAGVKFLWNVGKNAYHLHPSGKGIHLTPWKGDKKHFTSGRGLYLNPYHHGRGIKAAVESDLSTLPSHQKTLIKALVKEAIHQ